LNAALEGARVIRREPKAVLSWVAIWILTLFVVGGVVVFTGSHMPAPAPSGGVVTLARRYGPFWPILISALLVLWIMTTASVFRAVLRSDEHGWHLFKLGPDEARLAGITAIGALIFGLLGVAPAILVWVLTQPVLLVMPTSLQWVVLGGTLATVCLEIWIAVRLSLAPVYTFDTHHYHLVSYWDITQTHFWRLALCYVAVAVQMAGLYLGVSSIVWVLQGLQGAHPLAAEIIADLLKAVAFVLAWTIYCAAQAAAYKAILQNPPPAFRPTGSLRQTAA